MAPGSSDQTELAIVTAAITLALMLLVIVALPLPYGVVIVVTMLGFVSSYIQVFYGKGRTAYLTPRVSEFGPIAAEGNHDLDKAHQRPASSPRKATPEKSAVGITAPTGIGCFTLRRCMCSSRCLHDKEEAASAPRPMLQRDQGVVLRRGA
jgi:hypothetical protein